MNEQCNVYDQASELDRLDAYEVEMLEGIQAAAPMEPSSFTASPLMPTSMLSVETGAGTFPLSALPFAFESEFRRLSRRSSSRALTGPLLPAGISFALTNESLLLARGLVSLPFAIPAAARYLPSPPFASTPGVPGSFQSGAEFASGGSWKPAEVVDVAGDILLDCASPFASAATAGMSVLSLPR